MPRSVRLCSRATGVECSTGKLRAVDFTLHAGTFAHDVQGCRRRCSGDRDVVVKSREVVYDVVA